MPELATFLREQVCNIAQSGDPCYGHAHIVADDLNVEDSHLDYCRDEALKDDCQGCLALLAALRPLSPAERRRVLEEAF